MAAVSIMDNDFGTDIDVSKIKPHKLEAMKEAFPDVDHRTLARFLLARNGKKGQVALSTDLLKRHMAWENRVFPILRCSAENEFARGSCYPRGFDKEGHPLVHVQCHLHDAKDREIEATVRAVCFAFEVAISRLPPGMTKITMLFDRYGMGAADVEMVKYLSPVLQIHFPERLHRAIVYPSNVIFWGIYKIAELFMDPATAEKVRPVVYLKGVQEFIEDEHIPAHMGGKDDYAFNMNDFADPYPEEVVNAAKAKMSDGSDPVSIFEEPIKAGEGCIAEAED